MVSIVHGFVSEQLLVMLKNSSSVVSTSVASTSKRNCSPCVALGVSISSNTGGLLIASMVSVNVVVVLSVGSAMS